MNHQYPDSNSRPLFNTSDDQNLRQPPPPPPPAAAATAYAATSSGLATTDEDEEEESVHITNSKNKHNTSSSNSSDETNQSDINQSACRGHTSAGKSSHCAMDNCLMEKVRLLIDNYGNVSSTANDELSNLHNQLLNSSPVLDDDNPDHNSTTLQYLNMMLNPYHANPQEVFDSKHPNPMRLHFVPNAAAFSHPPAAHHPKTMKLQSAQEPDDSALGSDCATSASCNSSLTSKVDNQNNGADCAESCAHKCNNQPLGVCIGTLILGPSNGQNPK